MADQKQKLAAAMLRPVGIGPGRRRMSRNGGGTALTIAGDNIALYPDRVIYAEAVFRIWLADAASSSSMERWVRPISSNANSMCNATGWATKIAPRFSIYPGLTLFKASTKHFWPSAAMGVETNSFNGSVEDLEEANSRPDRTAEVNRISAGDRPARVRQIRDTRPAEICDWLHRPDAEIAVARANDMG